MPDADWCEIKKGKDFLTYTTHVDWIITNPPWRQLRLFLCHAFELANDVVFLMTVNHAWTKARLRDARNSGFGLKTILLLDTPREFPQTGFQLGAVHYSRGWSGDLHVGDLTAPSISG